MRSLLLVITAALVLSGCAGLNSRIRKNKELFETYPPEVQAMLKAGQVDRGFNKLQTYMALDNPSQKSMNQGMEVWLYTRQESRRIKHEKGALQYKNDLNDYEDELEEYERKVAEGRFAIEPKKPSPYFYTYEHRTRVLRRVYFQDDEVVAVEEPADDYLDDWH